MIEREPEKPRQGRTRIKSQRLKIKLPVLLFSLTVQIMGDNFKVDASTRSGKSCRGSYSPLSVFRVHEETGGLGYTTPFLQCVEGRRGPEGREGERESKVTTIKESEHEMKQRET